MILLTIGQRSVLPVEVGCIWQSAASSTMLRAKDKEAVLWAWDGMLTFLPSFVLLSAAVSGEVQQAVAAVTDTLIVGDLSSSRQEQETHF